MITQQIQKRQPYLIAILSIEPKNKTLIPQNHTYIYTSYIKWLEHNNFKWLQISENDSEPILKRKLKYVDGVLLTGGSSLFYDENNNPTKYRKSIQTIFDYANQQNDSGIKFPVLGTCLGFEFMIQKMTQEQIDLKEVVNINSSQTVYLEDNYKDSFLSKLFTQEQLEKFSSNPQFFFTHSYGYLMEDAERSKSLNENFKLLAYYFSETNQKALGIVQHKKYPYVGWQYHPEKVQFEQREDLNLNKCDLSLQINTQLANVFYLFLDNQNPKNKISQKQIEAMNKHHVKEQSNKMEQSFVFEADLIQLNLFDIQ